MTDPKTKISDKAQLATMHYINRCVVEGLEGYTWHKAMLDACYSPKYVKSSAKLVWDIKGVQEQIEAAKANIKAQSIYNRKQRQQFWTDILTDPKVDTASRLRASELLRPV
jgi:hypothetical protein